MGARTRSGLCVAAAVMALASTSLAQAIKISQVFGGGGNPGAPYNRDYVELFNAGATEVNISGWSMQYATAAGTTWQRTLLPGATIPPGGYFLIQVSSVGTVGLALPQPDHAANPGISMTSTSGKVALVRDGTLLSGACPTGASIIDLVGFGATASCSEGGSPAPAPSNTVVILRATDGCMDTGHNAADFVTGPADPRNSAITRPVCPGADLSVTIEIAQQQLIIEHETQYTIRVRNLGPDLAELTSLTVTLPSNCSLASSVPEAVPIDSVLGFEIGDLAADEEALVTVGLIPYSGTQSVLVAAASSAAPDAKPSNSTATLSTPIFSFARAKLFVGVLDQVGGGGEIRAVDVDSGASRAIISASVSGLAADNNSRRFFFSDGARLTIVPWATMTPTLVGTITGASPAIRGLAWHPGRRVLLGIGGAKIYEIDLQTAVAKLIRTLPGGDFAGMDHDVASNRVMATNNSASTTGGMSGRGIYRINPYSTELILQVAYPERVAGTPETDVDGCAVGDGRIYGVTDEAEWIYRYQQSNSTFLSPLPQPLTQNHMEAGSTFAPEFYTQSPGANIGIELATPRDCEAIRGQPMSIQITIHNYGPAYAIAPVVSCPIPTGAQFVGSEPLVMPVDGVLTVPIAGLGAGASATLAVTLVPTDTAPLTLSASVSAASQDALQQNNSASKSIQTQAPLPTVSAATAVLSTLPGSDAVPDRAGLSFSNSTPFGRLFRSPSGWKWILAANTTGDPSSDRVLIRGSGASFEVAAQEGTTPVLDIGAAVADFGPAYSIVENGQIALTTDILSDPLAGLLALRSLDGPLSEIVMQNSMCFPLGEPYGNAIGSITIQSDGSTTFVAQIGSGTSARTALLTDDGLSVLALTGTTVPTDQLAAPVTIESFASGSVDSQITWMNAAGDRWCTRADLTGPVTTDICLIINNEVRIQEGFPVPGASLGSTVSAIHTTDMESLSGSVFCRGSNADGKDWVWREGQIIASTGAPIALGQNERFADVVFSRCFFLATGNIAGDTVVGGFTDAADANANEVVVLNQQIVLLRENDVIDIDGDGEPDDEARIHSFRENSAVLTDDGWFYAVVRVRSSESVCLGTPTDIGQALIRKRVVCPADINRDGGATVVDIFAFLSIWFAQEPAADFNADTQVTVADIFAFLSAWFSGC